MQLYLPRISNETPSGFGKALQVVGDYIGDAMELFEKGLKHLTRIALRVLGPVIKLHITVGENMMEIVVKSACSLLRGTGHILKATLGLDLGKSTASLASFTTLKRPKQFKRSVIKYTSLTDIRISRNAPMLSATPTKNLFRHSLPKFT